MISLALITPIYIGYEYYENDPTFCTSCHLMQEPYELWRASAMHSVTCHNCHELDMPAAMNLVYTATVINPDEITAHADVPEKHCLECHAGGEIIYPQISDEIGHITHYFSNNVTCLECHGKSLHGFTPPDDICLECHDEVQKTEGMMMLNCKECHTYTAKGKTSLIPNRIECINCHLTGVDVLAIPDDGHEKSGCSNCHKLHTEELPLDCESCHSQDSLNVLHQVTLHDDCKRCHQPHQSADSRETCTFCHINKKNHNIDSACEECHNFNN